jgi:hypothetical protein
MPRAKGDGERAILRKEPIPSLKLTVFQWKDLEKLVGSPIPAKTRKQINTANNAFVWATKFHSPENTVSLKEIKTQIETWLKATKRLRRELGTPLTAKKLELTRAEFVASYRDDEVVRRIGKMTSLTFLTFAVQSTTAAANIVLMELQDEHRNRPIKNDLWNAWVCLIATILQRQGIKISASSPDKSARDSTFVSVIERLQTYLPEASQRYKKHGSLIKGIQLARRTVGLLNEKVLWALIAGFGTVFLTGYPGYLAKASPDVIAKFEIATLGKSSRLDPLISFTIVSLAGIHRHQQRRTL